MESNREVLLLGNSEVDLLKAILDKAAGAIDTWKRYFGVEPH